MKKKYRCLMAVLIVCLTLVGLIGTAYADQPRDIGYFDDRTVSANNSWTGTTKRYRSDVVYDAYSMCHLTEYSGTLRWITQFKDSDNNRFNATSTSGDVNILVLGYNYLLYLEDYLDWDGPDYAYVLRFVNTTSSSSTVSGEWGP